MAGNPLDDMDGRLYPHLLPRQDPVLARLDTLWHRSYPLVARYLHDSMLFEPSLLSRWHSA